MASLLSVHDIGRGSDHMRDSYSAVGKSIERIDASQKVTGRLRYTDDLHLPGMLFTALVKSPHAHAKIDRIDTRAARRQSGVVGIFTGDDFDCLIGLYLGDRPPLARGKVRHFGEPVAAVVAHSLREAKYAAHKISVSYTALPIIDNPQNALKKDAPILHENMEAYAHIDAILPEPGTNVGHRTKIRKGDIQSGFKNASAVVQETFSFPPGDHVFMEDRIAIVEIESDDQVRVHSATQSPFGVQTLLSSFFNIPPGKITVTALPVGGGFGGKAGIQLEPLAYLLSRELNGRPVRVALDRAEDFVCAPGAPGIFAEIKLGAGNSGKLTAMQLKLLFDSGAYADYAVNVSRAAGLACSGPYKIDHIKADSLSVYTNHPFATAYRGFGHIELAFVIERAMDLLAEKLSMDPLELRIKNAIQAGDTTPTQNVLDDNTGDLKGCLSKVAQRIEWSKGIIKQVNKTTVRAKGVACFWKAPAIPTNTEAGAILTFNNDGSINLATGAVEIGQGSQTGLAQMTAEAFGVTTKQVHVVREVSTDKAPHDWTTAASRTLFMAGNAALMACEDAKSQIREVAAMVFKCDENDLVVRGGTVFVEKSPEHKIPLGRIVNGYTYDNGASIGGPIIGRGRYITPDLTHVDPKTGKGHPGLEWTIGAQGVEVEVDLADGSYSIIKAACAMDVGKVIHPKLARGQVVGAMAMGIGFTTKAAFIFDSRERVVNASLRDFKILRYGEHPQYFVDFLTTPQKDGPFGARGLGEQGILGMPGALASAFSRAIGTALTQLPITPEILWRIGGIK